MNDAFFSSFVAVSPTLTPLAVYGQSYTFATLAGHAGTGFVLETSSTLSPTTSWTPVSAGVSTVGNPSVVPNEVGTAADFYRLRQP